MKKLLIIVCLALASCGQPNGGGKYTYEVKFRNGSVVKYEGNSCIYCSDYVKIVNGRKTLLVNFDEVLYVEKID
jgi:hypothetical protein